MNAYELAEKLYLSSMDTYHEEAANMLRQQADRIAELEKQSEPVAWWTGKYEDEGEDFMFPITRQAHIDHPQSETHKFFSIPLYTTPQTKPLTDEEIKQIWYDLYPLSSSSYWDDKREGLAELKFAKAILRKAQEK